MTESSTATDTIAAISTPPGRGRHRHCAPERAGGCVDRGAAGDGCTSRWNTRGRGWPTCWMQPDAGGEPHRRSRGDLVCRAQFLHRRGSGGDCGAWVAGGAGTAAAPRAGAGRAAGRAGRVYQRAFLAGKLDLTQAEAVRDLIEAQTLTQARQAASQMGGALSRRVQPREAVAGGADRAARSGHRLCRGRRGCDSAGGDCAPHRRT